MSEVNLSRAILLVDSNAGQYVAQRFAGNCQPVELWGISLDDANVLCVGPDHEHYWETWDDVLSKATMTDPATGLTYVLHQDGDLWMVPADDTQEN